MGYFCRAPKVSIEDARDQRTQERFKLNVPLGSIELSFGHTNVELPKLDWRGIRTICWLDYDESLTSAVLTDIRRLAAAMAQGSVLVVTVDARLNDESSEAFDDNFDKLVAQIGTEEKVPTFLTAARELADPQIKPALRSIMTQELKDGVGERNAGTTLGQRVTFEQIFNFEYRDGNAPMLTIGWVLFDEGQRGLFEQCRFNDLKFVRPSEEPFVIVPPFLTPHEMRELNRCDQAETYRTSDLPLPDEERTNYENIRRYWPTGGYAEMT